jgi:hypothetical protein
MKGLRCVELRRSQPMNDPAEINPKPGAAVKPPVRETSHAVGSNEPGNDRGQVRFFRHGGRTERPASPEDHGMKALAKNGLRYPIASYGIQSDARAGMGVSYGGK